MHNTGRSKGGNSCFLLPFHSQRRFQYGHHTLRIRNMSLTNFIPVSASNLHTHPNNRTTGFKRTAKTIQADLYCFALFVFATVRSRMRSVTSVSKHPPRPPLRLPNEPSSSVSNNERDTLAQMRQNAKAR